MRSFKNFDDAYAGIIRDLMVPSWDGHPVHKSKPRGMEVREIIGYNFCLKNPRARLLSYKERETSMGFAAGEFLWYWSGRNDLETMQYYNKRMKGFSDDGETLNSAYGYRMRSVRYAGGEVDQWSTVVQTLIDDPDSRRAVMIINGPEDEAKAAWRGSKDVPCTLSLQFFIRENKLAMHAVMRSNDVIWGLAYDLFSFTMFQECMLLHLRRWEKFKDLELGPYFHTAGSMHIYERHFDMGMRILAERKEGIKDPAGPMMPISSLENVDTLIKSEQILRTFGAGSCDLNLREPSNGEEQLVNWLKEHRIKRENEKEQLR